MKVTTEQLTDLANLIVKYIQDNFKTVHLSGNLYSTIVIRQEDDKIIVEIPAQKYDVGLYRREKKLVYTSTGSYASEVDKTGGFSGKHKDYVDKSIDKAVSDWLKQNNINGKVT